MKLKNRLVLDAIMFFTIWLVLAFAVFKMSFHHIALMVTDKTGGQQWDKEEYFREISQEKLIEAHPVPEDTVISQKTDNQFVAEEPKKEEAAIEESRGDEDAPSLDEYLKGLFCNGCGRHCSLLAPQCRKGVSRAKTAQTEYYNIYGGEE